MAFTSTLPFGLGKAPSCSSSHCRQPGVPLPAPGTPLHDEIAKSLSTLFSTFYATSLRYLGVSEILDWIECNNTIEAWILTGLEQGRSPREVASDRNMDVGHGAIRSVIETALQQEDNAWAHSLREVGFSSGMSMAYEGIISQLKPSRLAPLPCLHDLVTPNGLAVLKSAPLKHVFPVCPPRPSPSPQNLLHSIRSLINDKILRGGVWKHSGTWKPQVRRAFAEYHAMAAEVAEDLVSDAKFSEEYTILLEAIAQPIHLLQLIADDFESEFGPGACKGLLGIGPMGGQNLVQMMNFCSEERPSQLLETVKQRVALKKKKDNLRSDVLDAQEQLDQMGEQFKNARLSKQDQIRLSREQDFMEATIARLQQQLEKISRKEMMQRPLKFFENGREHQDHLKEPETGHAIQQGSSKDILHGKPSITTNPFAATAPRAVSPSQYVAKGKGRATEFPPATSQSRGSTGWTLGPRTTAYMSKTSMLSATALSISERSLSPARSHSPALSSSSIRQFPPSSPRLSHSIQIDKNAVQMTSPSAQSALQQTDKVHKSVKSPGFSGDVTSLLNTLTKTVADTKARELSLRPQMKVIPALPALFLWEDYTKIIPTSNKCKKKKKQASTQIAPPTVTSSIEQKWRAALKLHVDGPALSIWNGPSSPKCCPPDRCTGDVPEHRVWPLLDALLCQTLVAIFISEMIENVFPPLELIRDQLAMQYLLSGGKMWDPVSTPRDLNSFFENIEDRFYGLVESDNFQHMMLQLLASSMESLLNSFRSSLGDVCICRLSKHLATIASVRDDFLEYVQDDWLSSLSLPEMDLDEFREYMLRFMQWVQVQLCENKIDEEEWGLPDAAGRLAQFLGDFSSRFSEASERLLLINPYMMIEDLLTMLEWQGGIMAFDFAWRVGKGFGDYVDPKDVPLGPNPLQSWNHVLSLGTSLLQDSEPFNMKLAEAQKKEGNAFFVKSDYKKAILHFATASIFYPGDPTYWTNAAAARIKLGTRMQFAEAVSDCTFALYLDPQNVKARYRRGTALAMLGRWTLAISDFSALVKLSPDNQAAQNALAWAEAARNRECSTQSKSK